jgi:hypothetical protein
MTDKITTTLRAIRQADIGNAEYHILACNLGGIKAYGEDTPVSFRWIYHSAGARYTLMALSTTPKEHHATLRQYACDCIAEKAGKQLGPIIAAARAFASGSLSPEAHATALTSAEYHARTTGEPLAHAAAGLLQKDFRRCIMWSVGHGIIPPEHIERLFVYCSLGKSQESHDRLTACDMADSVAQYARQPHVDLLAVARRFATGAATKDELVKAHAATRRDQYDAWQAPTVTAYAELAIDHAANPHGLSMAGVEYHVKSCLTFANPWGDK